MTIQSGTGSARQVLSDVIIRFEFDRYGCSESVHRLAVRPELVGLGERRFIDEEEVTFS